MQPLPVSCTEHNISELLATPTVTTKKVDPPGKKKVSSIINWQ